VRRFYNLFISPSFIHTIKSRRIRLVGHVACIWERRAAYRVLMAKSEGRRPLGRPRLRWEGSNKTHYYSAGTND
jgi:hypothetical protein